MQKFTKNLKIGMKLRNYGTFEINYLDLYTNWAGTFVQFVNIRNGTIVNTYVRLIFILCYKIMVLLILVIFDFPKIL